jgi:hypothetical protein
MGAIDIPPARELAERAKRAATEVMRQNSELMNTHAENLTFAQEYFNRPLSLQDKVKLAKGLNKAFGKDFSLKGWVESVQHPDPRLTTKIDLDINDLISAGGNSRTTTEIPFKYIIKEISSDKMVTESAITRSITRNEDGSFKINNFCFSRIKGEFDNTYRNIASSIYSGTEKLLRDITANLPEQAKKASYINIGQAANSGFSDTGYAGAVVWAKNHYDFANLKEATVWRKDHKAIIDSHGARLGLTPEKIQELKAKVDACKYPYEFMSLGHKLSKEDCERAGGINRDIKRVIQDTGGYDIGAWIMLKRGTWWNAVNYINGSNDPARQRRVEHLNQQRDKARAIRAARSAERAANPNRPVTPPSQPVSESSAPTQSTTPSQSTTRRRTQGTRSTPRSGLPNASLGTMRVLNGSEIAGESFPSGLFLHRDGNKWAISHHKSGKRMLKVKNRALAQAAIVRLSTKNWEKSDVGVLASESHMSLLRGTINSIERDPNGFLREVMPSLAALQEAARSASRRRRRT